MRFSIVQEITGDSSDVQYPKYMNYDEMTNWILKNKLRDSGGKIDSESAKFIAGAGIPDGWNLEKIRVEDFSVEPIDYTVIPTKRKNLPIIVIRTGPGEYDVLDGKHRIAEAKIRGDGWIMAYVAKA